MTQASLPRLAFFTVPKAFAGHTGVIQRNAIKSWSQLGRDVEVILCGDDAGVAELADEVGAHHVRNIETTTYGTPLVSAAFRAARDASDAEILAYLNADIILLPDFADALARVHKKSFLVLGRRCDVELTELLDFSSGWAETLRTRVRKIGSLAGSRYIDYFVFPRSSELTELPPFVVGRPRWTNWLVFRARSLGIPVIDATPAVLAIHQNHDYSHVPERLGDSWLGPEADRNFALAGEIPVFSTSHATHVLRKRVTPALDSEHLGARWATRYDVSGSFERVGRAAEPILVPAVRLRARIGARFDARRDLADAFGGPYNGQEARANLVKQTARALSAEAAVETGTFRGTTTAALRELGMPVYTTEVVPRFYYYAKRRFRRDSGVEVSLSDSRAYLRQLAKRADFPKQRVLFYLDAHWREDLPLPEELEIISAHWSESVVIVDDFEVPDEPGYGFDDYGPGRRLKLSSIEPQQYGFRIFWPSAPSERETGSRRGCVVLVTNDKGWELLNDLSILRSDTSGAGLSRVWLAEARRPAPAGP